MDTNNPMDFDMFTKLQHDDMTQGVDAEKLSPTQSFVRKCLHPPSAVPNYCGLPTNDARSQVTVEWRGVGINSTPRVRTSAGAIANLTPADLSTFNYIFLQPSGARVVSIPMIQWANSTDLDLANVQTVNSYDFDNFRRDATLYRPAYKSITYHLNATAFNNTGTVVCNQFNPSILFSGTITELAEQNLSLFTTFCHSKHNPSSIPTREDIENWECLPKHCRDEFIRKHNLPANTVVGIDPNLNIQILNLSTASTAFPAPSSTQILQNSLRAYGGVAKEGVFSVQRLNTIAPRWLTASRAANSGNIPGLYQCYYYVNPVGTPVLAPFYENAAVATTSADLKILSDTLWSSDMTWSWVRFDGLALNTQSNVSSQLIIRKYYSGIEVQPTVTSAWSGMLRLAPKPDLKHMQALLDAFYELKDGMPARYNFWGELVAGVAPMITGALKDLGSSVIGGLFGKKNQQRKQGNVKRSNNQQATKKDIKDVEKQLNQMSLSNNNNRRKGSRRRSRRPLGIRSSNRSSKSWPKNRQQDKGVPVRQYLETSV